MFAKTIIDTTLANAWAGAVEIVRTNPALFNFGGGTERKMAHDSQVTIILDEYAVDDALKHIAHPMDPFATEMKIAKYLEEYKAGFDIVKAGFDYTYRDRLEHGFVVSHGTDNELDNAIYVNQLEALRKGLKKQIDENLSSNRNIAVTYNPEIDLYSGKSIPCWNEVLVRYDGNGEVSIHTLFRSHDLFGAWESNMIAILTMLNEDVVKPCKCKIKWVYEHNFSLHIYDYDMPTALKVKPITRSPILIRLQEKYDRMLSNFRCDNDV